MAGAHLISMVEAWPNYSKLPLEPLQIERILDGALYRLAGHGGVSTFSPNYEVNKQNLLAELGLSPDRKTIIAYSSSDDESVCAKYFHKTLSMSYPDMQQPVATQDARLSAIVACTGSRSDCQLVIRIHPRKASNHRFAGESEQVDRLRALLAELPANVVVVWPEMSLSSYNLAETADIALVAWSSMGIELTRLSGYRHPARFPSTAASPRNLSWCTSQRPSGTSPPSIVCWHIRWRALI